MAKWTIENDKTAIEVYNNLIKNLDPKNSYSEAEILKELKNNPLIKNELVEKIKSEKSYLCKISNIDYAFRKELGLPKQGLKNISSQCNKLVADYINNSNFKNIEFPNSWNMHRKQILKKEN